MAALAARFHKAAEIVRNGLIGKVIRVEVGLPGGHHDFAGTEPALLAKLATLPDKITDPSQVVPGTPAWDLAVTDPPADFDYETWIGPSQDGALHRSARQQKLALELQHRRRPADGLDRPPRRHRALGPRLRSTGPSEVEGRRRVPGAQRGLEHRDQISRRCLYRKGSHRLPNRCAHDHRRRLGRHQHGHEMDWHRRLGLGRSQRL